MIPASYIPRKKFMELAVAEAKRAGDRGDYPLARSSPVFRADAKWSLPAPVTE